MAIPVIMPRQGQSVESCILTEWYKNQGDTVSRGDLLFAYETDKAAFEEEAQADGILLTRFYEAGDEVPVLVNVAVIGTEGEPVDEFRPGAAASGGVPEGSSTPKSLLMTGQEPDHSDRSEVREPCPDVIPRAGAAISPRARRLACEKRVVVEGIVGSGPGGDQERKKTHAACSQEAGRGGGAFAPCEG